MQKIIVSFSLLIYTIVYGGIALSTVIKPFTAIPYYAWANRCKGEMSVWFP